jgi:hypothetical protein
MHQAFLLFLVAVSFVLGYIRGRNTSDDMWEERVRNLNHEVFMLMLDAEEPINEVVRLKDELSNVRAEVQRLEAINRGNY